MQIRLLGPLEVVAGDGRPVPLPRGRARSLLALLALRHGEVVATDRLVDELWGPSPPATATTALHGHVSTLRRRLEPDRPPGATGRILVTHAPGYVLAVDGVEVDAARFRRVVAGARGGAAAERADRLRAAGELWRGPALADFTYEPFAQAEIRALEELRLDALEARIDADLELGRAADVVAELEALVAGHPLREGLVGHLMVALYRCGRQSDALAVHRRVRDRLRDELGVEPGRRLQALEQAILRQHPALERPAARSAAAAAAPPTTPAAGQLEADRRPVTVVVVGASIVPDGTVGASADPETTAPLAAAAQAVVRTALERHGATVEGAVGDVVVAVFGRPIAHEDDATRAARAAVDLRRDLGDVSDRVRSAGGRLRVRGGIATGEVVVGRGQEPSTGTAGPPVSTASELQRRAHDGELLLGDATRRLIEHVARVQPVDRDGLSAWRLVELARPATGLLAPATAFVGRGEELARLRAAFDHAVATGRPALVTVVGEAGVGKSRLASAFREAVEHDARVLVGRCRAYGDGITFWPLREMVGVLTAGDRRGALADQLSGDTDLGWHAQAMAATLSFEEGRLHRPDAWFRGVTELFEAAVRTAPVVAVIDDLHWARPTFLDLVGSLLDEVDGAMLFVCLARPEPPDRRPHRATAGAATTIDLAPLSTAASRRLALDRLAGRPLSPETLGRVLALSQGNPLFLEQLLAAAREDAASPTAPTAAGPDIPATLRALLTARLDRLGPAERDVLRCASVVGLDVPLDVLGDLLPEDARPWLTRHVETLAERELVDRWQDRGRQGFDFRHALIRQAAYRSLTHAARAELHERVAARLGAGDGHAATGDAELAGHHLEQAVHYRRELGHADGTTRALAIRAGELLASAGLRAHRRVDVPAAADLLTRSRALLPADHAGRPEVLHALTHVLPVSGAHDEADAVFAELLDADVDDRTRHRTRMARNRARLVSGPDPVPLATIEREATDALDASTAAGDEAGRSQACYVLASVHLRAGRMAELEAVARVGLAAARRTEDPRELAGAAWWVVFAALEGRSPVADGIRVCEQVVDLGGVEHPGALAAIGLLTAARGDPDHGKVWTERALTAIEERFHLRRPRAFVHECEAGIELGAGRPDDATRALGRAFDILQDLGERHRLAQVAARLSILRSRAGDAAEAARLARLAREQAPGESVGPQALARAAQSLVARSRGDSKASVRLAREAADIAPADMLALQAELHVVAAEVLTAAGRHDDARSNLQAASALLERKGDVVGARRLRATGTVESPRRADIPGQRGSSS